MISDTTLTNGEMFGQLKLDKIKMELTDKITVDKNLTIKDGMKKIDGCGFGMVFAVDKGGRVCGLMTDGDIRRAILRGHEVNEKIENIMRKDYIFLYEKDVRNPIAVSDKIKRLYERDNVAKFIPVLDDNGRLFGLFHFGIFGRWGEDTLEKNNRRILVVGGAGYLGSLIVRKLLNRGYKVRVLDLFLFGEDSLKEVRNNPNLEIIRDDVRNLKTVSSALKGVDSVIHLAAIVGDPASQNNPEETIETNYLAAKMLAEACKYNQVNRLIYSSTCSVYGVGDNQLTEEAPLNPVSLYARTKIKSEEAILGLGDENFSPCILRMATLYGYSPRMRFDLVVNTLTMKAVTEGKINIFGGEQWRPLLHVEDAAQAYVDCVEAPLSKIKGEIFNVGSTEQNYQISELGRMVERLVPGTKVSFDESEMIKGKQDMRTYNVSFDKIKRILNYSVKRKLEESILEIKDKIKNGEIKNVKDSSHYNFISLKVEMDRIPYSTQEIDESDEKAVLETLRSGWLTQGPRIKEFEEKFSEFVGSKFAVAVPNGTAALHLACLACDLKEGDEMITTPMTFAASANCALYCGAKPVFADIGEDGLIEPEEIKKKITEKTRVIIPVHYAGLPCRMDEIYEIAKKNNLIIIEDACHAVGSKYKDKKIGACDYSDMSIFSFHPVKHITTGEGGMITTNSKEIYEKLIKLRTHGITGDRSKFINEDQGGWYHEMQDLGFNFRITDLQCSLGISQLKRVGDYIKKRRDIARRYEEAFEDMGEVNVIKEGHGQYNSFHLSVIKVDSAKTRRELYDYLKENNILCQVHYLPVYHHPYYQRLGYKKGLCPRAERFYERILSIPNYPKLSIEQQERVIVKIKEFFNRRNLGKVGAVIQVRMASSRLPGKAMMKISGRPILKHVVERVKMSSVDEVIIATSVEQSNDEIEKFCKAEGYSCFRGSENDVLSRYFDASKKHRLDTVIRICADDPLIDPKTIDILLNEFKKNNFDYLSNVKERSFPRGLDVEIFKFSALEKAYNLAKLGPEREHVTLFIYSNPHLFKIGNVVANGKLRRPHLRLCVDTVDDFKLMKLIFNRLYRNDFVEIGEVIDFLDRNPDIAWINVESEREQQMRNRREGVKQNILDGGFR